MLSLYRDALAIRRRHPGMAGEEFRWLPGPSGTLVFARGELHCAVNLSEAQLPLPENASILLASSPVSGGRLAPDSAAWFEVPAD